MGYPVVHFEIHGRDGEAIQKFYSDLFEWPIDANNPMKYGMTTTMVEGHGINGGITASESAPMVTIYVAVDDLQAALDKAETLGAKTVMPPSDVPGGPSIALFSDPEGNVIGLVKGM